MFEPSGHGESQPFSVQSSNAALLAALLRGVQAFAGLQSAVPLRHRLACR